jgi:hypothetical protein
VKTQEDVTGWLATGRDIKDLPVDLYVFSETLDLTQIEGATLTLNHDALDHGKKDIFE